MLLIKNKNQKEYLSKFCQDISKIVLAVMVITPLVQSDSTPSYIYFIGGWVAFIFFIAGYLLERYEV